jgi:hypothetical protein
MWAGRGDLGSSLERCRGEGTSLSRLETRLIPQDVLPFPATPSASISRQLHGLGYQSP